MLFPLRRLQRVLSTAGNESEEKKTHVETKMSLRRFFDLPTTHITQFVSIIDTVYTKQTIPAPLPRIQGVSRPIGLSSLLRESTPPILVTAECRCVVVDTSFAVYDDRSFTATAGYRHDWLGQGVSRASLACRAHTKAVGPKIY